MDIRDLSALQLGSAIKKKEIGCREAAEAYLTAIAEKDGKIKSYITVLDEEGAAREVSCAADGENTEKVLRSALSQAGCRRASTPESSIIPWRVYRRR